MDELKKSEIKKGDHVSFCAFTRNYPSRTGVVVRVTKFKHPMWGKKIIVRPDKSIDNFKEEVYRFEEGIDDVENCSVITP